MRRSLLVLLGLAVLAGGAGPAPAATDKPQVTVFELPKGKSAPGKDGRLKVWMRCTVPKCAVSVRILFVGDPGTDGYAKFKNPPRVHVVVGTTAKLVHLKLNRSQRKGLRGSEPYSLIGAIVVTARPGPDARMQTDGFYCRRADPCIDAPRSGPRR